MKKKKIDAQATGKKKSDLAEKIMELTFELISFYEENRGTSTTKLAEVLPPKDTLISLKKAMEDILNLWIFYECYYCLGSEEK